MRNNIYIFFTIIFLILSNTSIKALAKPYYKKTASEIYKEAESSKSSQECLGILSNIKFAHDVYILEDHWRYCDIMYLKARCLSGEGRNDEALSLLDSIYKLDLYKAHNASGDCNNHYYIPKLKRDILVETGQYQEALAHQNVILDSVGEKEFRGLYEDELLYKASILIKSQEYNKAIDIYDNLLEAPLYSSNVTTYQHLKAVCYNAMKEYDKAIEILDKIIDTKPEAYFYSEKALVLVNQQQYKKALQIYNEAIKLYPTYQYLYVGKARVLAFNLKQYKDAINVATYFINNFPDSPSAKPILHNIKGYSLMIIGKHKKAISEFNALHKIKINCSYIWSEDCIEYYKSYIWEAKCLTQLGKYNEALKSIDKVISIKSVNKLATQEKEATLKQKNSILGKIKSYFKK